MSILFIFIIFNQTITVNLCTVGVPIPLVHYRIYLSNICHFYVIKTWHSQEQAIDSLSQNTAREKYHSQKYNTILTIGNK